jgi:uncharacterized Zn-binding protein involved in type VI secretion
MPPCATSVRIGGKPAARALVDMATCAAGPPAQIAKGSRNVKIKNFPAARMGDPTAHGGSISTGCFSVRIGG